MKVEEKGHWIMKESRRIAKHPFLNRVPPQTAVRHLSIHRLAGTRWNPLKMRSCKFNANVIANLRANVNAKLNVNVSSSVNLNSSIHGNANVNVHLHVSVNGI